MYHWRLQENEDLSALVDTNDQIEENHLSLERKLRQDLDLSGLSTHMPSHHQ